MMFLAPMQPQPPVKRRAPTRVLIGRGRERELVTRSDGTVDSKRSRIYNTWPLQSGFRSATTLDRDPNMQPDVVRDVWDWPVTEGSVFDEAWLDVHVMEDLLATGRNVNGSQLGLLLGVLGGHARSVHFPATLGLESWFARVVAQLPKGKWRVEKRRGRYPMLEMPLEVTWYRVESALIPFSSPSFSRATGGSSPS